MSTNNETGVAEEEISDEIHHLTASFVLDLLHNGEVNGRDRRHAEELLAMQPAELTQANRRWLRSLARRRGQPFKP